MFGYLCDIPFIYFKKDLEGEEVMIQLTAVDPQAPKNKVIFDHVTGSFITIKLVDQMIDHLDIESTILHKDSEEAKHQMQQRKDSLECKINHRVLYLK